MSNISVTRPTTPRADLSNVKIGDIFVYYVEGGISTWNGRTVRCSKLSSHRAEAYFELAYPNSISENQEALIRDYELYQFPTMTRQVIANSHPLSSEVRVGETYFHTRNDARREQRRVRISATPLSGSRYCQCTVLSGSALGRTSSMTIGYLTRIPGEIYECLPSPEMSETPETSNPLPQEKENTMRAYEILIWAEATAGDDPQPAKVVLGPTIVFAAGAQAARENALMDLDAKQKALRDRFRINIREFI